MIKMAPIMLKNYFENNNYTSNFIINMRKFLSLKGHADSLNLLDQSTISILFSHYASGRYIEQEVNFYVITISTPLEIYAKFSEHLGDIYKQIENAASHLLPNEHEIDSVTINVDHSILPINENKELLFAVDRMKTILVARSTHEPADNEEYKKIRQALTKNSRINKLLPLMLRTCTNLDEFWNHIKPKYPTYAERREYIRTEFYKLVEYLEGSNKQPIHENITSALLLLNSDSVITEWTKALSRKDDDPKGSITISKTLLENLMKQLLNDLNIEYSDENDDIPQLYNTLANALNLSPSQHVDLIFKQILGGCYSIVQGLAGLRNKASDAHSSGKKPVNPAARHAEFVANIACALAVFLIQTWEFQKNKKTQTTSDLRSIKDTNN